MSSRTAFSRQKKARYAGSASIAAFLTGDENSSSLITKGRAN